MKIKNPKPLSAKFYQLSSSFQLEDQNAVCVRVAIIGCGYWGPNLIRNFHESLESRVAAVCDLKPERLKPLVKKYPGIKLTTKFKDILRDPAIDAVVIATPVSTHYRIASQALKAGKHVLVEKPLAANSQQCLQLLELARREKKVLMVGHTFEYNPAVLKVAELLKSNELGKLHYIDSVRVNLGLYQSDGRNVIWDLAPHDISIILHWVGQAPKRVGAWGSPFVQKEIEDVAFIRLEFPGGVLAHIQVSWLAPAKIRRMTVVGSKRMIIYDDLENLEKIKVADRGAHLDAKSTEVRISYRMGDILSPRLDPKEPLHNECLHFIRCILDDGKPVTDGQRGLEVVQVLEAADRSIKRGGRMITL